MRQECQGYPSEREFVNKKEEYRRRSSSLRKNEEFLQQCNESSEDCEFFWADLRPQSAYSLFFDYCQVIDDEFPLADSGDSKEVEPIEFGGSMAGKALI
jgi:hypothetical protein